MDRAYLALVQKRTKEYEAALLAQVTAESLGAHGAGQSTVAEARGRLHAALRVWQGFLFMQGLVDPTINPQKVLTAGKK